MPYCLSLYISWLFHVLAAIHALSQVLSKAEDVWGPLPRLAIVAIKVRSASAQPPAESELRSLSLKDCSDHRYRKNVR